MRDQMWPWIQIGGRVLFSIIFIVYGIRHFTHMQGIVGYATAKKVPAPAITVPVSGLMILVGGVFVLLGWHRYIGAGLLAIFLVLSAFLVHGFWKETDPMARQSEMAHFLKDLALAGAALFVAAYSGPSWPWSIGG